MSTGKIRIALGWFATTIAFSLGSVVAAGLLTLSINTGNALGLSAANQGHLLSIVSYAVVAGLLVDVIRMAFAMLDRSWTGSRRTQWRSHQRDSFRHPRHTVDA